MNIRKGSPQEQDRATFEIVGEAEGLMPPRPEVPPNVTEVGLPSESDSVENRGATLDYLPVAQFCTATKCKWTITDINYPILSIMTPDGKVVQPDYEVEGNFDDLLDVLMMAPESDLGEGTRISQVRFWRRLTQAWVPADEPHVTRVSVTEGITETESQSLSFTVGAKVGFNKVIFAELSAQLTESFGYSVSVSSEQTITEEFSFGEAPAEQVVGVYQLMERYVIYPGPNLANFVAAANEIYGQWCESLGYMCQESAAELPFTYPASSYLQLAGTDDPSQPVERRMLSPREIRELAESSLQVAKAE
ncbi:MAG: hypothetical protein PVG07_05730 [Acidobacteriota bacterium]|jgi:hypothetical protein